MNRSQVVTILDQYLVGTATLSCLEEQILSNLQATLDGGDEKAIELMNDADVLLMQLRDGEISERSLMEELNAAVVHALTVPLSCETPTIDLAPAVSSGAALTIHRGPYLSEAVVQVRNPEWSAP